MKRLAIAAGFVLICNTGWIPQAPAQTAQPKTGTLVLPAGTKIELAVTAPIWARTAKAGDLLYTQVDFPVIAGQSIAIPAGTYVQGTIQSISRPSLFKSRAEIRVLFTTLIFANGYTVQLPALPSIAGQDPATASQPPEPSIMNLTVAVTRSNDLLLDNGTQFTLALASPLSLELSQIAAASGASRSFDLGALKSATLCRPTAGTPGTPGTPDTVIPGSPGTPSITVPGGSGMPDITIPGTPATPDTVIPGSPGTPGTPGQSCPAAPIVISSDPVPPPQPQTKSAPQHP